MNRHESRPLFTLHDVLELLQAVAFIVLVAAAYLAALVGLAMLAGGRP